LESAQNLRGYGSPAKGNGVSLEQLSAIAQIATAVAVVPSLIFVGIQLNLATKAVKASSSQAHTAMFHALSASIVENPSGFARIWRDGLSGTEALSDEDLVRFFAFISSLLRFFESARIQWLRKQLDQEHWRAIERQAENLAGEPGVQQFWAARRHWHCSQFQSWFNALIEQESRLPR
jgi:hypothetical protein